MGFSKINAVNQMLDLIGQERVNASVDESEDAVLASQILDENDLKIQGEGWAINSQYELTIQPDAVSKELLLPANTIAIRTFEGQIEVTLREGKAFDMDSQTFIFQNSIVANVITRVPFIDLGLKLQQYIIDVSANRFARASVGSADYEIVSRDDILKSRMEAKQESTRSSKPNVLRDNLYSRNARAKRFYTSTYP